MSGLDPNIRALLDEEAKATIRDRDERAASVWTAVARRITPPPPDGSDPSDSGPTDAGPGPAPDVGASTAAASGGGGALGGAAVSGGSASILASVTPWVGVAWTVAAVVVGAGGGWWLRGEQTVVVEREPRSATAASVVPAPLETAAPEGEGSDASPSPSLLAGTADEAEPPGHGGRASAPRRSPSVRRALSETPEETPPAPSVVGPEPRDTITPPASEAQEPEESTASSEAIEEAALIVRARTQLRRGAVRSALDALWDHAWRFPRGDLEPERERLFVEALIESGDHHAAAARATAFLRRFPESMHAESVRRFAAAALEAMRE